MTKCRFAEECIGYQKHYLCCNDEWEACHTCGKYKEYMRKAAEIREKESDKGLFGLGILGRLRRREAPRQYPDKEKLFASIKEFQRHIFRARGLTPREMAKAKEELRWALDEIEVQKRLGAPTETLTTLEKYINQIILAIDFNDPFLAESIFTDLFQYIADLMSSHWV